MNKPKILGSLILGTGFFRIAVIELLFLEGIAPKQSRENDCYNTLIFDSM